MLSIKTCGGFTPITFFEGLVSRDKLEIVEFEVF